MMEGTKIMKKVYKVREHSGFGRATGFNDILTAIAIKVNAPVPKPKPQSRRVVPLKASEDTIREIRTNFEVHHWSRPQVFKHYFESHGLSKNYLEQVLSYSVRSHIIPNYPHFPFRNTVSPTYRAHRGSRK